MRYPPSSTLYLRFRDEPLPIPVLMRKQVCRRATFPRRELTISKIFPVGRCAPKRFPAQSAIYARSTTRRRAEVQRLILEDKSYKQPGTNLAADYQTGICPEPQKTIRRKARLSKSACWT